MTDFIKRSDAYAEVDRGDLLVGNNASWAKECINRTPSVDVTEVKHGYWEPVNKSFQNSQLEHWTERYLKCSVCGYERRIAWMPRLLPLYCEECGADMRCDGNA